tara:strand:- start:170 stop:349 length:180 start_codon:yes stop_codon:yes gene_type:complete
MMMSDKIEDILYKAHYEGIKNKVLTESNRLLKQDKYKNLEVGDRLEIAYNKIWKKYKIK